MVAVDQQLDRSRRILVVDDSAVSRRLVSRPLRSEGLAVDLAEDALTALAWVEADPPDLILLDRGLPELDGFEAIRRLKAEPRTRSIPVIFLSATTSTAEKARGLDLGAVDFLTKPCDPIELRARVRAALRTKDLQDQLERRAHLDGLTGLGNRLALEERLETEWRACARRGESLAVLMVDLDHFKAVNDRYGHAAGDETLRAVAEGLRSSLRAGDSVARFGGEEFVALAPGTDLAGAVALADRVRTAVAGLRIAAGPATIRLTTSVGVAIGSAADLDSPAALLERADAALYRAKDAGRDATRAWSPAYGELAPVGGLFDPVLSLGAGA